jgi:hypothetical protein
VKKKNKTTGDKKSNKKGRKAIKQKETVVLIEIPNF